MRQPKRNVNVECIMADVGPDLFPGYGNGRTYKLTTESSFFNRILTYADYRTNEDSCKFGRTWDSVAEAEDHLAKVEQILLNAKDGNIRSELWRLMLYG
jgi:hypothetical protein